MAENNLINMHIPKPSWRVAVTSRSFSKNTVLKNELKKRYPHASFNEAGKSLNGDGLVEFLRGNDMAITALERIDEDVVKALPDLKIISKYGVGIDMINLGALKKHNVQLGWQGGVNKRSVAELAIAMSISLLRHIPAATGEVLDGVWRQHIGRQVTGKHFGIVGFGHVGKELARLLEPFNCTIMMHDILDQSQVCKEMNVIQTSLDDILRKSDVVSLHLPLDESTKNIISAEKLAMMKDDAILINTARGNLVDETGLKLALKSGKLGGAAFDVFANEPPEDFELLKLSNFLVTPHIGGSAIEAILAMGMAAIDGLDKSQEAIPENFF